MKKLILKALMMICFIIIVDYIIGTSILHLSKKMIIDKRFGYVLNGEINKDIIFIGSSRSARNVIAKEISDITGLSSYNLGYIGSNIEYHNFLLDILLKYNKSPKYIVLSVDDPAELISNNDITFRYDVVYNYTDNILVRNKLVSEGKMDKFFSDISHMYRARNSLWELINISEIMNILKNKKDPLLLFDTDGSMPLKIKSKYAKIKDFKIKEDIYTIDDEDPKLLDQYLSFVDKCQRNKIDLIILFPPNYYSPSIRFNKRIREVSGKETKYLDYSVDTLIKEKFFYDSSHLNYDGAVLFSRWVGHNLKKVLCPSM